MKKNVLEAYRKFALFENNLDSSIFLFLNEKSAWSYLHLVDFNWIYLFVSLGGPQESDSKRSADSHGQCGRPGLTAQL